MELTVHELRLMGGVCRAVVVVSTVLGIAMLNAGAAGADGPVQLKSRLGDVCLDGPNPNWRGGVLINPCNGTDFQRWNLNGQQFESVAFPGKCLTAPGDSWVSYLGPCFNSLAQHWDIQPNGQVTTFTNSCLAVLGGPAPGTWVSARWCDGDLGQGWDSVP
jgi:Ricin-type beta-trefoil lectin domain